jgi:hypothetical protein
MANRINEALACTESETCAFTKKDDDEIAKTKTY